MRSPTPIPVCPPEDILLVAVMRAKISLKEEMISDVDEERLDCIFVPEGVPVEEMGL
jgi:hypothetical protein